MRQQALILIAAVSIVQSASAQQRHVFPNLNLTRVYNVSEINKSSPSAKTTTKENLNTAFHTSQYQLDPRIQFGTLQKQLDSDIRYLKIEKRNQFFQGLFQSGMQATLNKNKPTL